MDLHKIDEMPSDLASALQLQNEACYLGYFNTITISGIHRLIAIH